MIKIGKTYITEKGEISRLCADIMIGEEEVTLYFSVERKHRADFSIGRSDAFVMALLPVAMQRGENIVCEEGMSQRLYYQLCEYLIPAIVRAGSSWHPIEIRAMLTAEAPDKCDICGTVFFPSEKSGQESRRFIREQQLQAACVDLNGEAFQGNTTNRSEGMGLFWRLAGGLALQRMFSTCVLFFRESGKAPDFGFSHMENTDAFLLLTVQCASTENLSFLLLDYQRRKKLTVQMADITKRYRKRWKSNNLKKIMIGKPYIEKTDGGSSRLCAAVTMGGRERTIWFGVEAFYERYLAKERGDAFVTALLTEAMRQGADIVCEAPVTERLLYQINTCLVPMLSGHIADYYPITVTGQTAKGRLPCEGAVGCGWTGGVDSMFTYLRNLGWGDAGYRLTHLLVANNGAVEGEFAADTFRKMAEKTKKGFAAERNLKTVGVDTNLQELLKEKFITVAYIRHVSVVLALQKLFHVFFFSSGIPFRKFEFHKNNASYYDSLLLHCFETDQTIFYCSGAAYSRLEKLEELADFPLAHRMLHPCIYALREKNCGCCGKCIRTMTELYSLRILERFSAVFDTEAFEKNKDWYLAKVLQDSAREDCKDVIKVLRLQGEDLVRAKRMQHTIKT